MIIDVQPKSELLRKYILGFNMFEECENFDLSYFVFPQFGSTLELFENTQISKHSKGIKIAPVTDTRGKNSYSVAIFGKYTEPVSFNYEGYVNGFGINFKPTGINYFFDKSYKKIAPYNFQEFSDVQWQKFATELFSIKDFTKRVEFAETFLESIFNDAHLTEIEKAIEAIFQDQTVSINDLAELCNMSARSLLRKFNEYVGCSPAVYKRIVRFRKTIEFNAWKEKSLNCTDICYTNNYFDTSHLRKEFRKLTHQNPRDFFRTVSAVGNHKFPYKLV